MAESSKILRCVCKSPDQDARYGKDQRVHNWALKKKMWRCTVCAKEQG